MNPMAKLVLEPMVTLVVGLVVGYLYGAMVMCETFVMDSRNQRRLSSTEVDSTVVVQPAEPGSQSFPSRWERPVRR